MTKEEEIRANVAVATVQLAFEQMANQAIEAKTQLALAQIRIKELEDKYENAAIPVTPVDAD